MPPSISMPSVMSLAARLKRQPFDKAEGPLELGTATAFVVIRNSQHYLVTNWHVLTGMDPETGDPIGSSSALPDTIEITHNSSVGLGTWASTTYELYDKNGHANWLIHPQLGHSVDVVAILLGPADDIGLAYLPYSIEELSKEEAIRLQPTTEVSIIGFPFGLPSHGGIGIWARGTVASEPELDYKNRPMFLIDSRTRQGQSGSPVISYATNGTTLRQSGTQVTEFGVVMQLHGVYSGRIREKSDIGMVWRTEVLRQIIDAERRDTLVFE